VIRGARRGPHARVPRTARTSRRAHRRIPDPWRAEQHVGDVRGSPRAQALPEARGRGQPGHGDRSLPHRAHPVRLHRRGRGRAREGVGGGREYRVGHNEPMTMAILHQFVPNSGDAWRYTREEVRRYFDRALAKHQEGIRVMVSDHSLLDLTTEEPPPLVAETLGAYIEFARLLGRRTAELHQALGSGDDDPAFVPEPITGFSQREMYQSMRNLPSRVFRVLNDRARTLPADVQSDARALAGMRDKILSAFNVILGHTIAAERIRIH